MRGVVFLSPTDTKVRITADSTCDIGLDLARKYNISIVPLYVNLGDDSYRDGVDITPGDIYDYYDSTHDLAKTSAVSFQDYIDFFRANKADGEEIIHIGISQVMSACYKNAAMAASEIGGVHVVDSRNLSTAIGQLVLLASEMAAEGKSAIEIVIALKDARARLDASFVIDNMEFLRKGGRCSSLAAISANLLQIKPCIKVIDGEMTVGKKYRGNISKALLQYVDDALADPATIDKKRLFITHTGCDSATVDMVKARVAEHIAFDEVIETMAGATITCHAGLNTLGLLFLHL